MAKIFGGITIAAGRPGGVPTHVVDAPAITPGTRATLPVQRQATIDPFAAITRMRKALGRRLS